MHRVAHGGCTDTVREYAMEADLRKVPCCSEDSQSEAIPTELSPCPRDSQAYVAVKAVFSHLYPSL